MTNGGVSNNMNTSFLFSVVCISVLSLISIIAMIKYPIDQALKVWAIVGPMLASSITGGSTYFFAAKQVDNLQSVANTQVAAVAQTMATNNIASQAKEKFDKEKIDSLKIENVQLSDRIKEITGDLAKPK